MLEWVVNQTDSGMSIQAFLKSKLPQISGKQLKAGINGGFCRINGKVERFSSRPIGKGDRISFEKHHPSTQRPELSNPEILYSDQHILAINKPSGLSSDDVTFLRQLKSHFPDAVLLHRLDKETTGVLLFAQSKQAEHAMLSLFKQRHIKKTYVAIVDGTPGKEYGVIENFLGALSKYNGQVLWGAVSSHAGKWACTHWRTLLKGGNTSLLECIPETGRTHQIRVHLKEMGHPILGDFQYGRTFACPYRPARCLLHALEVKFKHPLTNQEIHVRARLPDDFEEAIQTLFGVKWKKY
jgi:RluA family pseudouridine synthase